MEDADGYQKCAMFPREALSKNAVNVIYFPRIYMAASSLNVHELFDSKWGKKSEKSEQ